MYYCLTFMENSGQTQKLKIQCIARTPHPALRVLFHLHDHLLFVSGVFFNQPEASNHTGHVCMKL